MKVGFIGTRNGMTAAQLQAFTKWICELPTFTAFHHGDCVGADDEAASVVRGVRDDSDQDARDFSIVCHPPLCAKKRANNETYDEIREPKTYFARNRDIVDETDVLIATPRSKPLPDLGGMSYTVNYAHKQGKPVYVVWTDGRLEKLTP